MSLLSMLNAVLAILAFIFIIVVPSIRIIGPTEIGLVMKRFSFRKLSEDNPIAMSGEAGYQADLCGSSCFL